MGRSYYERIEITEEPCTRYDCQYTLRCKLYQMACKSFYNYVNWGIARKPTEPLNKYYVRIFEDGD